MSIRLILIFVLFLCGLTSAQVNKPEAMPPIQVIEDGFVERISDNINSSGRYLPPWKEVTIEILNFKKKAVIGQKATIIPLDIDMAPFDLEIIKAEEQKSEGQPSFWEVGLKPLTEKKFFEIAPLPGRAEENPFDVVIIYPAVKFARQIKKNQLTKNMLPKGVAVNSVKAAIDVTNDGNPDVLIIEYCCNNPGQPVNDCDYTCGKTYKKVQNVWKLVDSWQPH